MLARKKRSGIGKKTFVLLIACKLCIYGTAISIIPKICFLPFLSLFSSGILDSSPKASVIKNVHLLTKETMQDTVNMLGTPTRRNRFNVGNNYGNIMNDDSPILSQESINISWKWNNEGTPIRSTNKSSKLRRSITNNSAHLHRLPHTSTTDNAAAVTATATTSSPKLTAEPETHSPKGLYKFQEEMRKIQFDAESDTSCDNINDKSMTADTGYPTNMVGATQTDANANANTNARSSSDSLDVQATQKPPIQMNNSQHDQHGIDDAFADDLLNDSDFDQILLTCNVPAQREQREASKPEAINKPMNVKRADAEPAELKPSGSSNSSGSNWDLIGDDCFDDLVKDFDVDIPVESLNTSAKFTRHKSMPQQQPQAQASATTYTKTFAPQQSSTYNNQNYINQRKSFTRHESMPITNTSFNRPPVVNNNYNHNNNNNNTSRLQSAG